MNKKISGMLCVVSLTMALFSSCVCGSAGTPVTTKTTSLTTTAQATSTKPPTSSTATLTQNTITQTPTTTKPTTSASITPIPPTTQQTTTNTVATTPTTSTTTQPQTATTSTPPASTGESIADILGRAGGINTIQYDMEISGPSAPPSTMKVWLKGSKMRMETTSGGQPMIILVDNTARTSIIIMGTFAMSQTWQEQDTPTGQAGDIMTYKPVILREETLDGKLCTVIQYTYANDSSGTVSATAWIWKQYGFPIKVESTDSRGQVTTMIYKDIVIGGNIPDSTFQVPAGVTVMTGIPTSFPGM